MRLLLIGSTILTVTLCGCATQSQVAAGQQSRAPVATADASVVGSSAISPLRHTVTFGRSGGLAISHCLSVCVRRAVPVSLREQ